MFFDFSVVLYKHTTPFHRCGCLLLIRPAVIRNLSEYQLRKCSGFDAELMKWTLKHQHTSCRQMEAEQCLNIHTGLVYSIAPSFPI